MFNKLRGMFAKVSTFLGVYLVSMYTILDSVRHGGVYFMALLLFSRPFLLGFAVAAFAFAVLMLMLMGITFSASKRRVVRRRKLYLFLLLGASLVLCGVASYLTPMGTLELNEAEHIIGLVSLKKYFV